MRKMRKQPVGPRNDWNHNLEIGDRVYTWVKYPLLAVMDDLMESNGRNKAALGELTPRRVIKDGEPRIAMLQDGVWYWVENNSN